GRATPPPLRPLARGRGDEHSVEPLELGLDVIEGVEGLDADERRHVVPCVTTISRSSHGTRKPTVSRPAMTRTTWSGGSGSSARTVPGVRGTIPPGGRNRPQTEGLTPRSTPSRRRAT